MQQSAKKKDEVKGKATARLVKSRVKAVEAGPPSVSSRVKTKISKERLVIDRHRRITDAAIATFETKGYHGTTMRDVGQHAGLPQGTIYNYVESKEDILYLVCDRIVTDYQARVRAASKESDDPVARLKSVLRAICGAMIDHKPEIRILYREIHHLSPEAGAEILARINEFVTQVEAMIDSAVDKDRFNVRFACNIVTFLPSMFALRSWVTPADMPESQQVDELVQFLCDGLGL